MSDLEILKWSCDPSKFSSAVVCDSIWHQGRLVSAAFNEPCCDIEHANSKVCEGRNPRTFVSNGVEWLEYNHPMEKNFVSKTDTCD